MFTRDRHAALLHDAGGKTSSIGGSLYRIQSRVIQYRRTGFFICLLPRGLACKQAQLAISLTPWNAEETKLLDAVQGCPGANVLSAVP